LVLVYALQGNKSWHLTISGGVSYCNLNQGQTSILRCPGNREIELTAAQMNLDKLADIMAFIEQNLLLKLDKHVLEVSCSKGVKNKKAISMATLFAPS